MNCFVISLLCYFNLNSSITSCISSGDTYISLVASAVFEITYFEEVLSASVVDFSA